VGAAVLTLIGRSSLGADGVLVTLCVALAIGQGLTLITLAHLVRSQRRLGRQHAEADRLRSEERRLLNRLVRLTDQNLTRQKEQGTALEGLVEQTQRTQSQVLALGSLASRSAAEAREHRDRPGTHLAPS
jgi:uncharacterized protein HemX